MPNCSVFRCSKRSATSNLQKDGVSFHKFPKDPIFKDIWKIFCNNKRTWKPTKNSVICSEHFLPCDFQKLTNNRRKLVEFAKPTLLPENISSRDQLPQIIVKIQSQPSSNGGISSEGDIKFTPTIQDPLASPHTPSNHQQSNELPPLTVKNELQLSPDDSISFEEDIKFTPTVQDSLEARCPSPILEHRHQLPFTVKNELQLPLSDGVSSDEDCQFTTTDQDPLASPTPQHTEPEKTSLSSVSIPTTELKIKKMQWLLDCRRKKIKRLQAQILYLKKKVAKLEKTQHMINKKSFIDKENKILLEKIGVEEKELVKRQVKKSKSGKLSREKYSTALRRFALTLYSYSPKSYKYVRETFGACLPAPRTLAKWNSHVVHNDGRSDLTV